MMPQKQEHRTEPNQRVVIKGDVTHMYDHARAFNEAIVRDQTHDDLGYPLIYIEWDKDHWAYSGEPDRWVFESHFDPVEEKKMTDDDKFKNLLKGLMELAASFEDEAKPEEKEFDPRPQHELSYEYVLQRGIEEALNGEGFLLFVASNQKLNEEEVVVPLLYLHSKSDDAALLVDAAAADHVAHSMGRLIQENVRSRRDGSTGP